MIRIKKMMSAKYIYKKTVFWLQSTRIRDTIHLSQFFSVSFTLHHSSVTVSRRHVLSHVRKTKEKKRIKKKKYTKKRKIEFLFHFHFSVFIFSLWILWKRKSFRSKIKMNSISSLDKVTLLKPSKTSMRLLSKLVIWSLALYVLFSFI